MLNDIEQVVADLLRERQRNGKIVHQQHFQPFPQVVRRNVIQREHLAAENVFAQFKIGVQRLHAIGSDDKRAPSFSASAHIPSKLAMSSTRLPV